MGSILPASVIPSSLRLNRWQAAEELARRRLSREHLLPFVEYTHPTWMTGDHHRRICGVLERVERGELNRVIVEAPPRHSKSEIMSRRFGAWYLGRHPDRMVIALAYAADLAVDEYGRKVRNIIREPEFQAVFPSVSLAEDSKAAGRWNTNQGGSYIAGGVASPVTGRGAHLLIIDDPFKNREEADSAHRRNRVWAAYDADLKTRLMHGGAILIGCTRWHQDDLVGRVLKYHGNENWYRLTLPAIADEGSDHESALWPAWFPIDYLQGLRDSYLKSHPRDWYSLYQQNPRPSEGTYMQAAWFTERCDKPPPVNVYIASDYAVTEPEEDNEPDYTEHGVFGMGPDGVLYPLDWWAGQTSSNVWIDALLDLVAKWKPFAVFGEEGVIRHAIEPFLIRRCDERRIWFRAEWLPSIHDKAIRGRAFQARAAMGRIRFPNAPWAGRVIQQCVDFPGALHDDAFDACSLMCLAIDQAHPAIVPLEKKAEPRDHWKHANKAKGPGWRVA